jgi:hypothetical protein
VVKPLRLKKMVHRIRLVPMSPFSGRHSSDHFGIGTLSAGLMRAD